MYTVTKQLRTKVMEAAGGNLPQPSAMLANPDLASLFVDDMLEDDDPGP